MDDKVAHILINLRDFAVAYREQPTLSEHACLWARALLADEKAAPKIIEEMRHLSQLEIPIVDGDPLDVLIHITDNPVVHPTQIDVDDFLKTLDIALEPFKGRFPHLEW